MFTRSKIYLDCTILPNVNNIDHFVHIPQAVSLIQYLAAHCECVLTDPPQWGLSCATEGRFIVPLMCYGVN